MTPPLRNSPPRIVLVLILFLTLTAGLGAYPAPRASAPPPASVPALSFSGVSTNRTTVVRIAAVGMALALFIMYRSKH